MKKPSLTTLKSQLRDRAESILWGLAEQLGDRNDLFKLPFVSHDGVTVSTPQSYRVTHLIIAQGRVMFLDERELYCDLDSLLDSDAQNDMLAIIDDLYNQAMQRQDDAAKRFQALMN